MVQLEEKFTLGEGSRRRDSEVNAMNRDYRSTSKEWIREHNH